MKIIYLVATTQDVEFSGALMAFIDRTFERYNQ